MQQPGIRPPVRRFLVETLHIHQCRPRRRLGPCLPHIIHPPLAQPLLAVGDESPVGAPPLFPLGVKRLVGANLNIFTPNSGGVGAPLPPSRFRPRQIMLPPPPPFDHP